MTHEANEMKEYAFPYARRPQDQFAEPFAGEGMELRDYFAAKAMQGLCANPVHSLVDYNPDYQPEQVDIEIVRAVKEAYQIADAMLEARKT